VLPVVYIPRCLAISAEVIVYTGAERKINYKNSEKAEKIKENACYK